MTNVDGPLHTSPTKVVVTGASGNVGSGVLRALIRTLPDTQIVGVCRRPPAPDPGKSQVSWLAVDLASAHAKQELASALTGADVVVHLALAVQPVRDEAYLHRVNVQGSQAVLDAMVEAGVKQLVYASSLGVYAPGANAPVTEDWPDTGQVTSIYSRHKVEVERLLDRFARRHPDVVVGRFRPTVVVQRDAAWLIRSLYLGPLVPQAALELVRRRRLPVCPLPAGLALQFVHADDVGDAVLRMILNRAVGSYNLAAEVMDATSLGNLVGGRPVGIKPQTVRAAVSLLSRLRVIALTPGWYDVATNTPLMDTSKARDELGWEPRRDSPSSARELIEGLADEAVGPTAATGCESRSGLTLRRVIDGSHDASLLVWTGLTVGRAVGNRRAGAADAAAVAVNLVAGTPRALTRIAAGRRDLVALLAPVTVMLAVGATVRGGWAAVAATGALNILNVLDRRRAPSERTGHG